MKLSYICPYWGSEKKSAKDFFTEVVRSGYDGVEINMPEDAAFISEFLQELKKIRKENPDFIFIAQQVLSPAIESPEAYTERMLKRVKVLNDLQPDFINSHTGKDYFSFEENEQIIQKAEAIALASGIKIVHEIHRGRFTFHPKTLLPYLKRFPNIALTADFSHWCAVSESMLEDQKETIEKVLPHISHIHSRIGFEQGSQVNDPFAPEWSRHKDIFMTWWQKIVDYQRAAGKHHLTITPEFGPVPYMPTQPFSQQPLSDQWLTNNKIKDLLKTTLT